MSNPRTLLPFQPATMSTAQLAAVSFLARYSGRTHHLYQFPIAGVVRLVRTQRIDPLVGVQRAHVELYIRSLAGRALLQRAGQTPLQPHTGTAPDGNANRR